MINHCIETMPFGKFKDVPLDEVPEQYLLWLVTGATDGLDHDLFDAIRHTLEENAVQGLTKTLRCRQSIDAELLKCMRALKRRAKRVGVDDGVLAQLNQEIVRLRRRR